MEEKKAIKDDGLENKRNDLINLLKARKAKLLYMLLVSGMILQAKTLKE